MRPDSPDSGASTQIVPDSKRRAGTGIRSSRNHRYAVCGCTPFARAHSDNFTHSVKHTFDHIYSHNTEQFATPFDSHFDRAERLLHASHDSIRSGDHLGAIHGLEGVWSTVELLVDRITDEALLEGIQHADQPDTDIRPAATSGAQTQTGPPKEELLHQVQPDPEPPIGDYLGSEVDDEQSGEDGSVEGGQANEL